MLHEVKFRCGHIGIMDLTGQAEERAKKSDWYAKHVICPDCRSNAAMSEDRRHSFQRDPAFPLGLFSISMPK